MVKIKVNFSTYMGLVVWSLSPLYKLSTIVPIRASRMSVVLTWQMPAIMDTCESVSTDLNELRSVSSTV